MSMSLEERLEILELAVLLLAAGEVFLFLLIILR